MPPVRLRRLAWLILAATTSLSGCSREPARGLAASSAPSRKATEPSSPSGTPLPAPANGGFAARIDARIAAEGEAFSGVVLVARDGVAIYQRAVGLADREWGRPNTMGTRFDVASLTKMFTGVAVLQLVQAGRVRLDAPLGTYLADYPNQEVARAVTIDHLLTHTGGTGDIFGPLFVGNRQQLRSLEDYVALLGSRALLFEPGSRWEYSNYGFVLLGRVIEQVSGQSYSDYVAEHVFASAGMTHTDFGPFEGLDDSAASDRAIGYTRRRPGQAPSVEPLPNTSFVPLRSTSAGGVYSTAADLLAFAKALESHGLLDAEHTELLTTGRAPKPDGGRYAYGFSDAIVDGQRCIGHSGGGPGMNAHFRMCRAPGEAPSHVVVVLTNVDPPTGQVLMRAAREALAPDG